MSMMCDAPVRKPHTHVLHTAPLLPGRDHSRSPSTPEHMCPPSRTSHCGCTRSRSGPATPGVVGDDVWLYEYVLIESVSTVPSSSSPTSALAVVFLNRASRSRRARPFSPPPFTLTAAHPSPPAPPHVCRVQPKHPCIACRTHSAQAVPLPRPEHAHTHRPPCRPHVAGAHVSGPGWRLPECEKTFFGAISTCASASSQRCHVRVRLLPFAVASCCLLWCLAVWPVCGRW